MKRIVYFVLSSLFFLCACEQTTESLENEIPERDVVTNHTGMFCPEVPGTRVVEEAVKESLSHEDLLEVVNGQVYKLIAIYNCFERNDSLFYVIQPRDSIENNLNCLYGLLGEPTRFLTIENNYTIEWKKYIGADSEAYYRSYSYKEATQTFTNFVQAGYSVKEFKVQYVDKECMVLFADAVYDEREKHNAIAQFSRIVYKSVDKSEVPDCDIIDKRS